MVFGNTSPDRILENHAKLLSPWVDSLKKMDDDRLKYYQAENESKQHSIEELSSRLDAIHLSPPPNSKLGKALADCDKRKEKLFGQDTVIVDASNPSHVIVRSVELLIDGKNAQSFDLSDPSKLLNSDLTVSVKEGYKYRIKCEFHVQKEIVSGLYYKHNVNRSGITVEHEKYMMGSYTPKLEIQGYKSPNFEHLAKGKYFVQSSIADAHNNIHLDWHWTLHIIENIDHSDNGNDSDTFNDDKSNDSFEIWHPSPDMPKSLFGISPCESCYEEVSRGMLHRAHQQRQNKLENLNNVIVDLTNPSRVIVRSVELLVDDKYSQSFDLWDSSKLPNPDLTVNIKEGSSYRLSFEFHVQRNIVTGLHYEHKVKRSGITIENGYYRMGRYVPDFDIQGYESPIEKAPSGMMNRGKYKVHSKVTDDRDNVYLDWQWTLHITKE